MEHQVSFDTVWNHVVHHWEDIMWAALFGIFFSLIFDILNPQSRTRAGIRYLNNRWAEQSIYLLTRRIEELEKYKKQLSDVRWQYLYAFQLVFVILFSFCLGSASWVMSTTELFRIHPDVVEVLSRFSLCCFAAGAGISISGVTHVWRDTPEKVQAVVRKVGLEIEGLQKVLRARSLKQDAS